jgi:hypothetical protein
MKHPFQAVAVRYVHDVLSGEFLNIGAVLLCPERGFAGARFLTQWSRVSAAFPNAELPLLRRIAVEIESACAQAAHGLGSQLVIPGEQEQGDVLAFVGRIVPRDDASIQLSPVIRGVTEDPDRTLHEIYRRYAERYLPEDTGRALRDEADIWTAFAGKLASRIDVNQSLSTKTLTAPGYRYDFERAWKNGKWNIAQPVSFDLRDPRKIREKATQWTGRVVTLRPSHQDAQIVFLVGVPPKDVRKELVEAATDAVHILSDNLAGEADVVMEERSDELADRIVRDLAQAH